MLNFMLYIKLFRSFFYQKRWVNAVLVWLSFYWAKHFKNHQPWGLPLSLSVEPTTACNLGCPECPSGLKSFTRPTGNLNLELFKKIINEQVNTLIYCNFYFQGEPFIHPKLLDMVSYANHKKIITSSSTNAHFIDLKTAQRIVSSGLSRLIISIDGTTQETYEQYRRQGSLDKVIEGTKNLVKAKSLANSRNPQLIFQFLVVRANEHQTKDVKELAKQLGVDKVVFKTAQLYDYKHGHELMPKNEKYSRYTLSDTGEYKLKNKLLNQCWRLWSGAVITWDGKVVPCCFDKDASHEMGNVSKEPFSHIWNNQSYRIFRKKLLQSRKEIDICTNCSEGTQVWTGD